jgi:hypothetical protein
VNPAHRELIQTTFARLAVMPELAGALFYERLFATNPSFRPLFKKDIRIQVGRLMTMLATVVYNLHQPGKCQRSVVLPSVTSSMASSSPTTSRCGKRCSGPSNRRLEKISRPPSTRRQRSTTMNSPVK